TASLQRRRADAVGIIADPRYTEELLHQAHQLLANTPAAADTAAPSTTGTATADTATSRTTAPPAAPTTHPSPTPPATPTAADATTPAPTRNTDAPKAQHPTPPPTTQTTGAPTGPATPPNPGARQAHGRAPTTAPGSTPAAGPVLDGETTTADVPPAPTNPSPAATGLVLDGATTTADLPPAPTNPSPAAASARVAERGAGRSTGHGDRGGFRPGGDDQGGWSGDDGLLIDWGEPGPEDEADRDAPHPGDSELPDPLDAPYREAIEPFEPGLRLDDAVDGEPMDAAARRVLQARLARIRRDAHTDPGSGRAARPGQTEIYVHLTDHTLATGTGVLRAETIGPLLATQLAELIGHGPYTVKPVIDLNDAVSVDAYEIPDRIRERTRLTHPVELFPYGSRETHPAMDLDHIQPYDPLGPPGQTSTSNLVPLRRFPHRIKTHGRWQVRRLNPTTLEWTTPNGFTFHVDPTGTHPAPHPHPDT
ncbi:hypothetical protein ACIBL3_06930, partial [Kribbella sp. NPDC050124]